MHPELTEEHEALREVVREFVVAEIEPHAEAWDRDHTFPVDTVLAMGELGLFGIPFPEPYGGGGDLTGLCVAIEELARADQSVAITLEAGVGLGANPIHKFGTPEQQERWLPDLCAGRALGGFGLTEPDAGSDAGGTRTRAALDDSTGEWVIDGEKSFITNSGTPITSIVTVTALTGPGEISTIVVPAGTPGFEVQPPYRKMGWHASDTHGLTFVECRVPEDHLLGAAGAGVRPVPGDPRRRSHRHRRPRRRRDPALRRRLGRLRQRAPDVRPADRIQPGCGVPLRRHGGRAGGRPPARVPRGVVAGHRAAVQDGGRRWPSCSPRRRRSTATRSATQVFGGYGFMDETPVSRHYRDAKILEIGEGTSEVQRLVISRALGLRV